MLVPVAKYGVKSHPTRVCGLKYIDNGVFTKSLQSHPTRVRGLKYFDKQCY